MKINNIQKFSFGLGGGVNAIKTDFFVWYLGAYYLTVLGLNPLLTGLALLMALIIDAISDPLIGTASDRIRSKFGRRHLLMAFSLLPISLSYLMLFLPDPEWAENQFFLFAWLLVFAVVTRFSVTLFDIPHRALAAEIPESYEDKANIMSLREGFQSLIALSHSFIILPFINLDGNDQWFNVGIIGSIIMFVLGLISIIGTMSLIPQLYKWPETEENDNPFKEIQKQISFVYKNKTIILFLLGSITIQLAWGLANSLTFLTQTQFWGLTTLQIQEFIKIYFFSTIVSWFLVPKLVKNFEKRTILLFSLVVIGIFQATPFILYKVGVMPEFGSNSLVYFLAVFIFITGTFSIMSLMTRESMVPDMIDQVQQESNLRQDGTISSLTSFCAKCMTGLGQFFSMFVLWLISFPQGSIDATFTQREMLALFQGPMIMLLFLIPIVIFSGYKIDRKKHREILQKIKT
ncbi:MFS transporter [Gammaproteobacteria bacterium]|nr:MFS transporter [Gammaproteobacteria bacterium]